MAKKKESGTEVAIVSHPAAPTAERAEGPDLSHIAESLRPLAVLCDHLTLDPANARTHPEPNLEGIKASLRVYGQRKAIVVNRRNNVVEAGNGALMAARALGWSHIAVVWVDDDPATAAGFSIADNRTAELAEWDNDALDKLLREVSTTDEALQKMLADLATDAGLYLDGAGGAGGNGEVTEDGGGQVDRAKELQEKWGTKSQQLWRIPSKTVPGKYHRLLCGDSTKPEDVARVIGGEKAGLCFTSPPYGQQRDYTKAIDDWDALMQGVFANLPMADDGQVLVNLGLIHRDGEWIPYWDGWIEWMREQGWRRFGWYVWDQGFGLPGDWNGRLAPSHEFVFHFNREAVEPSKWVDKKPENIKPRNEGESTMRGKDGKTKAFTNPGASGQPTKIPDSIIRVGRQVGSDGHPAQFPVGFPAFVMESWPGLAFEPFAGSGTTLVAAEQLGRLCYGIEISPGYCGVILERLSALGLSPTLDTPP